jgi:dihydrofolate reductase
MPVQVVYYAAMSLDGRISGPDHDLSFLQTLDGGNDYLTFYEGVDSLIMGARTWDFMVLHGSWPYDKPAWVVTHADELDLGKLEGAVVETFAGEVAELVRRLGERGYERAWLVGGGELAGQFLAADLLDELILTVAPTLVGQGPALAEGEFPLPRFTLAAVERFGNDGARLRYERLRSTSAASPAPA